MVPESGFEANGVCGRHMSDRQALSNIHQMKEKLECTFISMGLGHHELLPTLLGCTADCDGFCRHAGLLLKICIYIYGLRLVTRLHGSAIAASRGWHLCNLGGL